jgi:hypothetical protein
MRSEMRSSVFESLPARGTARWLLAESDPAVHELHSPAGVVGRLVFDGDRAVGETAAGSWVVKQDVTRTVRVWNVATRWLAAEMEMPNWTGHRSLVTASGERFTWRRPMPWRRRWHLRSSNGSVIDIDAVDVEGAVVTIEDTGLRPEHLAIAVLIASYIVLRRP